MPSPPPPPPPVEECIPIGNIFLYKAGLNAIANQFLATMGNPANLGTWANFMMSPSRSLVLNSWRGDVLFGDPSVWTRVTIYEYPYILIGRPSPGVYEELWLGTYLCYANPRQKIVGVGQWRDDESLLPGEILNETARYNGVQEMQTYCYDLEMVQPPPPPPPAPPPAPLLGSLITTWEYWYGDASGWVCFTQNPNGTFNFRAEIDWYKKSEDYLMFDFIPPNPVMGKSFVAAGYMYGGPAINASVYPAPEDPQKLRLQSSSVGSPTSLGHCSFEANNIP